jgi:hypothetical protein
VSGSLTPASVDWLTGADVVAVGILDTELAKAAGRVVDRVVDGRATLLQLRVDRLDVVDSDVDVPDFVHDPPVGDDPLSVIAEGHQDDRVVAFGDTEVGRVAVCLAAESEAVAVVLDRALQTRDEEHRGASRKSRGHLSRGLYQKRRV